MVLRSRAREDSSQHRWVSRRLLVAGIGAVTVAAAPLAPAQAAVLDGDQVFKGDTIIGAGDAVNGNVTVKRGHLIVEGVINGNVRQQGAGGVEIRGGEVHGNIHESGPGHVRVGFWNGTGFDTGNPGPGEGIGCKKAGAVFGNIDERGPGADYFGDAGDGSLAVFDIGVIVECAAEVTGNIDERAGGDLTVIDDGTQVGGNVREAGRGDLGLIFGATVDGNACERGPGDFVLFNANLGGDQSC